MLDSGVCLLVFLCSCYALQPKVSFAMLISCGCCSFQLCFLSRLALALVARSVGCLYLAF